MNEVGTGTGISRRGLIWVVLWTALLGGVSLRASSAFCAEDFRVGLVLDKGGKDDKSFNAAAYRGALDAVAEFAKPAAGAPRVTLKYVEATDDNAMEPMLRSFAEKNFDLIIAVGVSQADAVKKVSAQFPARKFAIVDADVKASNVRALLFQEHEGSFVVGAIAAWTSKTGTVGFIGGMDIPLIRRFEMAYKAGATWANPQVKVLSNYVGVTGEAWNNPAKAKELALAQYGGGADVIFAAAGASGNGLYDAAEEKSKLAIGVDSNQNWIKPGFILTSMLKRVDVAVLKCIEDAVHGRFTAGTQRFGLSNGGVDYAVDQYNDKLLPAAVRAKADGLKAQIVSGKVKVPDYYEKR